MDDIDSLYSLLFLSYFIHCSSTPSTHPFPFTHLLLLLSLSIPSHPNTLICPTLTHTPFHMHNTYAPLPQMRGGVDFKLRECPSSGSVPGCCKTRVRRYVRYYSRSKQVFFNREISCCLSLYGTILNIIFLAMGYLKFNLSSLCYHHSVHYSFSILHLYVYHLHVCYI